MTNFVYQSDLVQDICFSHDGDDCSEHCPLATACFPVEGETDSDKNERMNKAAEDLYNA